MLSMEKVISKVAPLRGKIKVPGDKSISHRAVILGSLASGITRVEGFLEGEDCYRTVDCFRKMGVEIQEVYPGGGNGPSGPPGDPVAGGEAREAGPGGRAGKELWIQGRGLEGLEEPGDILDAGNSGTTARLVLGILGGNPFYSVLTGDASLRNRPMGRVVGPLTRMGARFWGRRRGTLLPVTVLGGRLEGVTYPSPVASAQVKSAVLLAGLFARGTTVVVEPHPSRDHTERMLKYFGARVMVSGRQVGVEGRPSLGGQVIRVPGDFSSAAFFLVAASLVPGSELEIQGVGVNPTRTGLWDVLQDMGARLSLENPREEGGEPVADLRVKSAPLRGTEIGGEMIPRLIDEIPVLAVAAALAEGKTVIRDAAELRVKESDRIATMAGELGKLGARVDVLRDGMIIQGPGKLVGAPCFSHGDHRVAMALAVAGLVAEGETRIQGSRCVNISFPGFFQLLQARQG